MRPRIFDYQNYPDFLRDMMIYLKKSSSGFSHRKFAKKAGFNSSSILSSLINRRSRLSLPSARKVGKGLDLSLKETKFLLRLVQLDLARTPEAKRSAWETILRDKNFQEIHPLAPAQYRYYAHWYYPFVREMVALGFNKVEEIASRSQWNLEAWQIEEALKDLEAMRLIETVHGILRVSNQTVMTDREPLHHEVLFFQEDMIQKASNAMRTIPRERRDMRSSTFSIDSRLVPELKSFLQSVLVQAIEKFEKRSENPDSVYQLNLQAFPLSSR